MIGLFRFTVFFSIIFSSKVFVKNQAEIFKGGFTSPVKKITTTATSRKICNANFCEELIGVLGESISPNEASGTLGKWLATCVPRHYENRQSAPLV